MISSGGLSEVGPNLLQVPHCAGRHKLKQGNRIQGGADFLFVKLRLPNPAAALSTAGKNISQLAGALENRRYDTDHTGGVN